MRRDLPRADHRNWWGVTRFPIAAAFPLLPGPVGTARNRSGPAVACANVTVPQAGLAEDLLDPGEEPGEIELVWTGLPGGFEVGPAPVARRVAELGVEPPGLGAVAVMVVVGEEPGQVAQFGGRAGGPAAPP